ncbi:MAG: hypothetical protein MR904_04800 [Clostridia bacterium]|nr:hypothetical protein [Clostridia bacterium]
MAKDNMFNNDRYFTNRSDLRMVMVRFGFDFSLLGSVYLYEMLNEVVSNTSVLRNKCFPTMVVLADRHCVKLKTFNRDIRWAISKAFNQGLLKFVPIFENLNKAPSTKQVLAWLYAFYVNQY